MQILQHPQLHQNPLSLSSSNAFSSLSLLPKLSSLTLLHQRPTTIIRMGGGPRTYPGGVSKWQWKRMQAKKAKQLLKARLCRERQIYEMRKRAELKAAVAELERPWEVVERAAPKSALFSVGADEQLKVLADRFQKPGGFDLWSVEDGPQLFQTPDGLPTARFFPKGVVHSVKPYGIGRIGEDDGDFGVEDEEKEFSRYGFRNSRERRNGLFVGGSEGSDGEDSDCLGSADFIGGDTEGGRVVHDGQGRISRGGLRNSRGRRSGKLRNGQFVGGSDGSNGEDSDFSGLRGFNGGALGGRYAHSLNYDGQRRISRGGLRNSRGRRNGKPGNGQFVGGSEGSDGKDSDSWGSRDREEGRVHSHTRDRHSRISRGGLRNSRGRESGKNSSRRMGNGSFVGVDEMSDEGSYLSGSRGSYGVDNGFDPRRNENRVGGDYMKTRNGNAFRSADKDGANVMDLDGRIAHYRMNGSRRLSTRGRFSAKSRRLHSDDVFDMSLQHDGSYVFSVRGDAA